MNRTPRAKAARESQTLAWVPHHQVRSSAPIASSPAGADRGRARAAVRGAWTSRARCGGSDDALCPAPPARAAGHALLARPVRSSQACVEAEARSGGWRLGGRVRGRASRRAQ